MYMYKGWRCGLLKFHWAQFWVCSVTISLSKHAEKISLHKHMGTWCLMSHKFKPMPMLLTHSNIQYVSVCVCACKPLLSKPKPTAVFCHGWVLRLPIGQWSSAAGAEKESEGGPRVSSLDTNQICSSAGMPSCFIKPDVLTGLSFNDTISQNIHPWVSPSFPKQVDRSFPFKSSHPHSFFPPPSAACPSPTAGTPLWGQWSKPEGLKLLLFLRGNARGRKPEWNESKQRCGREVRWSFLNKFLLFPLYSLMAFSFWAIGSITSTICYPMFRSWENQVSMNSNKIAEEDSFISFPGIT